MTDPVTAAATFTGAFLGAFLGSHRKIAQLRAWVQHQVNELRARISKVETPRGHRPAEQGAPK